MNLSPTTICAGRGRIGVLTFHRCINYGSHWQARSLVAYLQSCGYEVEVLDHHSRDVEIKEWRVALRPIEGPVSDRELYRRKAALFQQAICELPLSQEFDLDGSPPDGYDAVIVGSDEVWNFAHPWYGQKPIFFGDNLRAQRLISYAATFGTYAKDWGLHPWWAGKLRQFERISVRDTNSQELIRTGLTIEAPIVLDPCLLHPIPVSAQEGKYIAVYGHEFSPSFAEKVEAAATTLGLPTISIGYRNDWADEQWIGAGPMEFASFMAGASAVATNFFHGCVFALRSDKPLAAEVMPYREIKVRDLLCLLEAEEHLTSAETPHEVFEKLLSTPSAVSESIECLRNQSKEYLQDALTA